MIEDAIIDGRKAKVAYLTREFEPVSPERAELIKVIFDDGGSMFLVPVADQEKSAAPQSDAKTEPQDEIKP